jgi:cell division protein FtsQ
MSDGVAVPIDPRFRRRLIELRRREGRRRLRVLGCTAAIAMVAAAAWGASRSPLLDVDHVRLTGTAHTQPLQVIQTAGTLPGRPMVDLDEAAAAQRIERLPWVADATVRRRWPNTVSIDVRERAPAASVPAVGGGWALVDDRGRVLEPVAGAPADRPALEGVPAVGAAGTNVPALTRAALEVAGALPPALRARVGTVARETGGEMQLRLRAGGVVRLGDTRALTPKLVAAQTVLARVDAMASAAKSGNNAIAVLDVSVPDSPVLTRR